MVTLGIVVVQIVGIGPKRVCAMYHRPAVVVILPVVVWLRPVWLWTLVVRGGQVRLLVVCIGVRLWIEGVVASMAQGRRTVVVVVVVVRTVGDILYRVLRCC